MHSFAVGGCTRGVLGSEPVYLDLFSHQKSRAQPVPSQSIPGIWGGQYPNNTMRFCMFKCVTLIKLQGYYSQNGQQDENVDMRKNLLQREQYKSWTWGRQSEDETGMNTGIREKIKQWKQCNQGEDGKGEKKITGLTCEREEVKEAKHTEGRKPWENKSGCKKRAFIFLCSHLILLILLSNSKHCCLQPFT